jgi:hypothetical protein
MRTKSTLLAGAIGSLLAATSAQAFDPGVYGPVGRLFLPQTFLASAKYRLARLNPIGLPGDGDSQHPSLDREGNVIAFETNAPSLRPAGHGNQQEVVVKRTRTGDYWDTNAQPAARSKTSATGPTGDSWDPRLSAGGGWVAFTSDAKDLYTAQSPSLTDTNVGAQQVFVSWTGSAGRNVEVVSVNSKNVAGDGASGRAKLPNTDTNTALTGAAIDSQGLHVAFTSDSTNLNLDEGGNQIPKPGTIGTEVFVRDLDVKRTRLASVNEQGVEPNPTALCASEAPSISGPGRFVVFTSTCRLTTDTPTGDGVSKNIYLAVLGDRPRVQLLSVAPYAIDPGDSTAPAFDPVVSGDATTVVFASATNFLWRPGDPKTFPHTQIWQLSLWDKTFHLVSHAYRGAAIPADGNSRAPAIASTDDQIAYQSTADDLVMDQPAVASSEIYRWISHGETDETLPVSNETPVGGPGPVPPHSDPVGYESWWGFPSAGSESPAISRGGRTIAFDTKAALWGPEWKATLAGGHAASDVFTRRQTGAMRQKARGVPPPPPPPPPTMRRR